MNGAARLSRAAIATAGWMACAAWASSASWGCSATPHPQAARPADAPAAPGPAVSAAGGGEAPMPHGDHRPRYGGLVLMNGNLHFEVVAHPDGHYQVYFSDEVRRELPASTVSEVVLTVTRPHSRPETLILNVDDAGESWVAKGRPIESPEATIRVAFVVDEKPYWIDVPWSQPVPAGSRMTSSNPLQRTSAPTGA
jgi:hypothetical protein